LTESNSDSSKQIDNANAIYGGGVGSYNGILKKHPELKSTLKLADVYLNPEKPVLQFLDFNNSNGIPITAKHAKEAVQFLNWLNAKPENMQLLNYGIEGKHWKAVGDDKFERLEFANGKQYLFQDWYAGYAPFLRFSTDRDQAFIDVQKKGVVGVGWVKGGYVKSPVLGFKFDSSKVKTQYANVLAQIPTLQYPIQLGVIDYDSAYSNAIKQLKAAGIDQVIAEYQRQLNDYMAK
jgi:putative aldouronate transport system substrate-binding protein